MCRAAAGVGGVRGRARGYAGASPVPVATRPNSPKRCGLPAVAPDAPNPVCAAHVAAGHWPSGRLLAHQRANRHAK